MLSAFSPKLYLFSFIIFSTCLDLCQSIVSKDIKLFSFYTFIY